MIKPAQLFWHLLAIFIAIISGITTLLLIHFSNTNLAISFICGLLSFSGILLISLSFIQQVQSAVAISKQKRDEADGLLKAIAETNKLQKDAIKKLNSKSETEKSNQIAALAEINTNQQAAFADLVKSIQITNALQKETVEQLNIKSNSLAVAAPAKKEEFSFSSISPVPMTEQEFVHSQKVRGRSRRKDDNFKWLSGMVTTAHAKAFQDCKDWLNDSLGNDGGRYTSEDTLELMIETMRHHQLQHKKAN